MKGVPVQQSGGRRDAYISFDIGNKRIDGNGGCNTINGNYTVSRNTIRFTDVIATKMSCNDIEFENTFLSTLNTVDRYEVKANEILLKKKRTTVLVLRSQ
jgi:heat shock protein HslJ